MAEWTHRICERCFYDSDFGVIPEGEPSAGAYRMPTQLKEEYREPSACCMCGGFVALTAIYIRKNEVELMCHGRHDDLSWSHVGTMTPP